MWNKPIIAKTTDSNQLKAEKKKKLEGKVKSKILTCQFQIQILK